MSSITDFIAQILKRRFRLSLRNRSLQHVRERGLIFGNLLHRHHGLQQIDCRMLKTFLVLIILLAYSGCGHQRRKKIDGSGRFCWGRSSHKNLCLVLLSLWSLLLCYFIHFGGLLLTQPRCQQSCLGLYLLLALQIVLGRIHWRLGCFSMVGLWGRFIRHLCHKLYCSRQRLLFFTHCLRFCSSSFRLHGFLFETNHCDLFFFVILNGGWHRRLLCRNLAYSICTLVHRLRKWCFLAFDGLRWLHAGILYGLMLRTTLCCLYGYLWGIGIC